MTTPQNPGDGDTPQDPSDPQNPYGTPPPPPPPPAAPPSTPIPPAPTTPIPAVPASPPPYGDAAPPAPPAPPAAPAAPAAPSYGQPAYGQPAYGQPAYGQPAYGQGGMPAYTAGAASTSEPGKGMAITALIASILGCTCLGIIVAVPLAIVVLVKSRGGKNFGKGLAITALVLSLVWVVVLIVGGVALNNYSKDHPSVSGLKSGDCFTAKGLTDESSKGVSDFHLVGCSTKHDGEVLATKKLSSEEAGSYSSSTPVDICTPPVTAAGKAELLTDPSRLIIALTEDASPGSGDKLVCVMSNADGSQLTSKLGS